MDTQFDFFCHKCDTQNPLSHCENCYIYFCAVCSEKHRTQEHKEHIIVPFALRGSTIRCKIHLTAICGFSCEQCDIPVCASCVSSGEHWNHTVVDFLRAFTFKKECIKRDLEYLKTCIYPKYQEIISFIRFQKYNLKRNSQKLTTALNKNDEDLHQKIDIPITKLKSDLDETETTCMAVLNKQECVTTHKMLKISESIADMKELVNSNNTNHVYAYKSRIAEYGRLPSKVRISLPWFTLEKINNETIVQHLAFLSSFSIRTEIPEIHFLDKPQIIADIDTEYGIPNGLRKVSCLNDNEMWTCGNDSIMQLYNIHGKVIKSCQTKSGNKPWDIAVTRTGDLLYSDDRNRTVNVVKNSHIQQMIRFESWRPLSLCITSWGDLLIIIDNEVYKQTKIVRYLDSKETHAIQFDEKGRPLYSYNKIYDTKYICENQNLDVCVADFYARAVIVVNQAGKHRFTYTGNPSAKPGSFLPVGISTDSQCRILTADNYGIHILNKDGLILFYTENFPLNLPSDLCVDTKDNLFVAEFDTGRMKLIKYCT